MHRPENVVLGQQHAAFLPAANGTVGNSSCFTPSLQANNHAGPAGLSQPPPLEGISWLLPQRHQTKASSASKHIEQKLEDYKYDRRRFSEKSLALARPCADLTIHGTPP